MPSDANEVNLRLDRAELGDGPEAASNPIRPQADASNHCQVSMRQTLRETLPSILLHPKDGVRKIKGIAKERKATEAVAEQHVPVLAPDPPCGTGEERLEHSLEPRRKFPPPKEFVHHPIAALKTVAKDQGGDDFAASVMQSEVSHAESVKLLRQEEKLLESNPKHHEAELQTFLQLKLARQDAFVRWSIDRHVRKVGVSQNPCPPPQRPPATIPLRSWIVYARQSLQYRIEQAAEQHIVVAPEEKADTTQELLISSIERVVIVSASFQSFVIRLRSISHWDDPRVSAGCMVLYFVFLFCSQITRSAILLVLFSVLRRRWKHPSLGELRNAVKQAEDQDQAVQTLTQLTLQYGTRGWVDHLVTHAGPGLLQYSEFLADLLEMIQNFYEWRDPQATRVLLYKLFAFWLLLTFTPTWLLVQMSFFMIGITFFVLEPIGHLFPKYQLLTSPMIWLMWAIPTHADWAIARLQAEAMPHVKTDTEGTESKKSSSSTEKRDVGVIGRYPCSGGILRVTTQSIAYTPGSSNLEAWGIDSDELTVMHKVEKQTRTKQMKGIVFTTKTGNRHTVFDLDVRDEIFSQILGYSRLQWKKIE